MKRRQSGFTLVEIAIVLVIIGLLLGGILKGQELINSARVRNLADNNSGIQAAYFGFIDRYRQVPGDMLAEDAESAIGSVVAGVGGSETNGGNGQIDASDWTEASALWVHLTGAGFLQGTYTGEATGATDYQAPGMAPVNAFNGYLLLAQSQDYASTDGPPGSDTTERLLLILGDNIPVDIARELDVKVDDQRPLTGVLRFTTAAAGPSFDAVSTATSGNNCVTSTTSGETVTLENTWDIETDAQNCNLAYLY